MGGSLVAETEKIGVVIEKDLGPVKPENFPTPSERIDWKKSSVTPLKEADQPTEPGKVIPLPLPVPLRK